MEIEIKPTDHILQGSLLKAIIRLGAPIALGSFAQTLYNLADAFWLGQLGREALAAPVISFSIEFFLIAIGIGFSVAGTSLVAQYIGANQRENACKTIGTLLAFLVLLSLSLSQVAVRFGRELLELLNTPKEAFDYTLSYYSIMMISMPLAFPVFVYQAAMNGSGDTVSPLKITLFTAVLNAIFDPVFIFGWLGMPAMGVRGAAWTTLITRALASLIGLYLFFSGKKSIHLKLSHLKPDIKIGSLLFKIGLPSSIGFAGTSVGFILLMFIVNQFGAAVVSTYGIGMRVTHFFMLPAAGITSAITAIVGQNLGARNIQRAKDVVAKGLKLMLMVVGPASIITALMGRQLTIFFVPGDSLVHELGQIMFYLNPPSVIFFGLAGVIEGAFQGAGYTIPVMISGLLRILILRVPVVYFLCIVLWHGPGNIYASSGIWWGMTFSNFCALVIVWLWYRKGKWAKARIHQDSQVIPESQEVQI